MSTTNFAALPLKESMLANLISLGYHTMTPIQAESLPSILHKKDVIAQAKTGSGKTAAFGIGILAQINVEQFHVQALVICPTRELADQVGKEIRRLARFTHNLKVLTLCGGTPIAPQYLSLEHGAHIIVGTPGRISDHLEKGKLNLQKLRTLVLDEADRMLDMGFCDVINSIIKVTPPDRQTLMFSATFPDDVVAMSRSLQRRPITIEVESVHQANVISQTFYQCEKSDRVKSLITLLAHHRPESCLVFCNTKQMCKDVASELNTHGTKALAMHGDLEQWDRDETLVLFSNKSSSILVATDVAARGLDIKDLDAVINFELPRDIDVYTHRIGRTARAGKTGLALSLFTANERYRVKAIEDGTGYEITTGDIKAIESDGESLIKPPMATLCISGGQKNKIRAGDILGALTAPAHGLSAQEVGKINIFAFHTYVAIQRSKTAQALALVSSGKIKGRDFKARVVVSPSC